MAMNLAIIGAGDLGQTLVHHISSCPEQFNIVGFYDDTKEVGSQVLQYPILGGLADVAEGHRSATFEGVIMGIGYGHLGFRAKTFEKLRAEGVPFPPFVHPSSYVDRRAQVSPGTILFPGCTLDTGVVIGENTLLNTGCVVAHDTAVGPHSFFGPGVQLAGFVETGSHSFLGIGTVVIDHLKLGPNLQTAGGAVVTKSFAGNAMVAGVPATEKKALPPIN